MRTPPNPIVRRLRQTRARASLEHQAHFFGFQRLEPNAHKTGRISRGDAAGRQQCHASRTGHAITQRGQEFKRILTRPMNVLDHHHHRFDRLELCRNRFGDLYRIEEFARPSIFQTSRGPNRQRCDRCGQHLHQTLDGIARTDLQSHARQGLQQRLNPETLTDARITPDAHREAGASRDHLTQARIQPKQNPVLGFPRLEV